jgi:hypothetical protein
MRLARRGREHQAALEAIARAALQRRLGARLRNLQRPGARRAIDSERRASARCADYRVGAALFDRDRRATCRIVDRNLGGFKLAFAEAAAPPDEFALTIPTLRFIGIVRIAWREGAAVGVSILKWREA